MPRGKKNSTTSATAKTASKSVAEPIKERAAASETKSMKPTAKKKAAVPKKATTTKSSAKTQTTKKAATSVTTVETGVLKSTVMENAEKEAKKSTAKTAKKTSAAAAKSKKPAVKKTAKGKSDEVLIQSNGKDYTLAEITETCKNAYRGGTRKQIKSIKVYVKAEGNQLKAYYVVNDSISGSVDL